MKLIIDVSLVTNHSLTIGIMDIVIFVIIRVLNVMEGNLRLVPSVLIVDVYSKLTNT